MEYRSLTLRGYKFELELDDNLKAGTLIDKTRNYVRLGRVHVPDEARKSAGDFQIFFTKICRLVVERYNAQYKSLWYGIEWAPSVVLSAAELETGYGRPDVEPLQTKKKSTPIKRRSH